MAVGARSGLKPRKQRKLNRIVRQASWPGARSGLKSQLPPDQVDIVFLGLNSQGCPFGVVTQRQRYLP